MMIHPNDISLYLMNEDVSGKRHYYDYVDQMAKMIVDIVVNYRIDYPELRKLVEYAEENHSRLNTG